MGNNFIFFLLIFQFWFMLYKDVVKFTDYSCKKYIYYWVTSAFPFKRKSCFKQSLLSKVMVTVSGCLGSATYTCAVHTSTSKCLGFKGQTTWANINAALLYVWNCAYGWFVRIVGKQSDYLQVVEGKMLNIYFKKFYFVLIWFEKCFKKNLGINKNKPTWPHIGNSGLLY